MICKSYTMHSKVLSYFTEIVHDGKFTHICPLPSTLK